MRHQNANYFKKGQFKIQQMSFMLLAVCLFFALIGIFYVTIQQKNLRGVAGDLSRNRAIIISEFISGMSEFSCGSYCIDMDRMLVFKNKTQYKDFFPNDIAYIKIAKISKEEKECNKMNYPNCSYFKFEYRKSNKTSGEGSFISLCRHDEKGRFCELGKIIIGHEVR